MTDKPLSDKTSDKDPQTLEAPLRVDVSENDFVPEEPAKYTYEFSEAEVCAIGSALSGFIADSWIFSPKDTIADDVSASYSALQLLKRINAALPPEKRQGCVIEDLLPFAGGDIYIDATYRLDTKVKGKVIAVAQFSYTPEHIEFRLFDPVRYPNAKKLSECLGDRVPLEDILSLQEVRELTEEEKAAFTTAIKQAWASYY